MTERAPLTKKASGEKRDLRGLCENISLLPVPISLWIRGDCNLNTGLAQFLLKRRDGSSRRAGNE